MEDGEIAAVIVNGDTEATLKRVKTIFYVNKKIIIVPLFYNIFDLKNLSLYLYDLNQMNRFMESVKYF
ncbi:MAG TPA: hypothetical protein DIW39_07100, partial [Enterococcus faecalis]|nr:hypothetical protein [Enterococcus faecalis]